MVCNHRIPSPCECRRMMCLKPLEVTQTSLTPSRTSLCNGNSCCPTASTKACWLKTCGAWLAPRGRPLRPRPQLAIYTCQTATELLNFHLSLTSGAHANHLYNSIQFLDFHVHFVFRTPKVMFSNPIVPYTIYHVNVHTIMHISHTSIHQNAQ